MPRPASNPHRTRTALSRSFDVYYRDAARTARMDALNAAFVQPGHLAFDIGAHVGDRTGSFLRLGARVVALEPQPAVFRALRLIYGRLEQVTLTQAGIAARQGQITLNLNRANPTISTASADLITAARGAREWQGQVWDDAISIPVTTLDRLIAQHGQPDFIKIDVEGFELEALCGLSAPVPLLSFEFTLIQRDLALSCLTQLERLGPYRFNYSLGEEHRLRLATWASAQDLWEILRRLPEAANSGDIFARLPHGCRVSKASA